MKTLPAPLEVMERVVSRLNSAYLKKGLSHEGIVQLHLIHEGQIFEFWISFGTGGVSLQRGRAESSRVVLKSTLYDFLALASRSLNPVWGVITGRLRFSGDTSFLSKAMPKDLFSTDISPYDDPPSDFERDPSRNWSLPETVLVINASPRAERGYTEFFLRPLLEGLESVAGGVEEVYLSRLKLNHCRGCLSCWLSGTGECILSNSDDFNALYKRYSEADLLVFAFPLYHDSVPAQLKVFLERTTPSVHPYMIEGPLKTRHPRRRKKDQSAVVFSISGFPEMENFMAVRTLFRQFSHNSHIPIVAEIFRPAGMYLYNNPLLYRKLKEVLEALNRAGKEIALKGRISRRTLMAINQRIDNVSRFRMLSNFFWREKIENKEKNY